MDEVIYYVHEDPNFIKKVIGTEEDVEEHNDVYIYPTLRSSTNQHHQL
jgi:hypothetical protein